MFYDYNDVTRVKLEQRGRKHYLIITRKRNDYESTIFVEMKNPKLVMSEWEKMDSYIMDKIENGKPGGYCDRCKPARCDEWVQCPCCQGLPESEWVRE